MLEQPIFKFAIREDLKDTGTLFLPARATGRATGWDVRAAFPDRKPKTIHTTETMLIPLGFRTFCPEDWWFELKPRSSTFGKKNLHCLYGTIDCDFEGQLLLAVQYIPSVSRFYPVIERDINNFFQSTLIIDFGEALGQIIPVKRKDMIVVQVSNEEYDTLCKQRQAERGAGGFGSSDKNNV